MLRLLSEMSELNRRLNLHILHSTRMPNYNLLQQPWLPWRRRNGEVEWGSPALLTDDILHNPVVALAAPRPDFDGALQEFLIGLLGVALEIPSEQAWLELWHNPPTPDELTSAFAKLSHAFNLDGDGPRAFQALPTDDLEAEKPLPVEELLVDSKTRPLFVKSGRVSRMGRPAAAMALVTMQTYAPEGGRGHFTSLRGGGPLTTLVDPRTDTEGQPLAHQLPLWQKLLANVETVQQAAARAPDARHNASSDIFPWLADVRTSGGRSVTVTEANASPWQAYFGLPRRIRLDFDEEGVCDLTGRNDDVTVTGFRLRPNGVRYGTWRHPLSPHYQSSSREMLPVHGQPGGIGWRDWIGMTHGTTDGKREQAAVVRAFVGHTGRGARIGSREARLHAFGYDTKQAKVRDWTDAAQPVLIAATSEHAQALQDLAARWTEGASLGASLLVGAVKRGLFQSADDVRGDFSAVDRELWANTEQPFFDALRRVSAAEDPVSVADEVSRAFAPTLRRVALSAFDRLCPGDSSSPVAIQRVVTARYNLARALGGWTPAGEKLFNALRIPLPGGGIAARKAGSRKRTEAKR